MSQQGKGSLLLPLGIGAGLLLLLTSMKKKEATTPEAAASPEDASALLPQITAASSAIPQIDPAPAPSYAQAVAKTAGSDEEEQGEDAAGQEEDPQQASGQSTEDGEDGGDAEPDDEDGAGDSASYASKGGGGSYAPNSSASSISTNRQITPLPAPAYSQAATNPASMSNRKAMRFQSDQARGKLVQTARNAKSIRFQSDQAKNSPLFIGKGKPRMGVRLPVTQRPGATAAAATTTASMPVVNVTSQPGAKPAQATIFPLKFGTTSPYVKEVQRRLGVSATGYFGTMTRAAIQKRFRVSEISEALYKQIITGKAPAQMMPVRKPVARPGAKPVYKARKPLTKKTKPLRRK